MKWSLCFIIGLLYHVPVISEKIIIELAVPIIEQAFRMQLPKKHKKNFNVSSEGPWASTGKLILPLYEHSFY